MEAKANYIIVKAEKAFDKSRGGVVLIDAPYSGGEVVESSGFYSRQEDGIEQNIKPGDYAVFIATEKELAFDNRLKQMIGDGLMVVAASQLIGYIPHGLNHNIMDSNVYKNLCPMGARAVVRYRKRAGFEKSESGLLVKTKGFREDNVLVELVSFDENWVRKMYKNPSEFVKGGEYMTTLQPSASVFDEAGVEEDGEVWCYSQLNVLDLMARNNGERWVPVGEFIECVEVSTTHEKIVEGGSVYWQKKSGGLLDKLLAIPNIDRGNVLAPFSIVAEVGGGITEHFNAQSWTRTTDWIVKGRPLAKGDAVWHGPLIHANRINDKSGKVGEFTLNGDEGHFLIDNGKIFALSAAEDLNVSPTQQSENGTSPG